MLNLTKNVAGKLLRCGYTTGACAAAAAKAAAEMLLLAAPVSTVSIETPGGVPLTLPVLHPETQAGAASCAVLKDAGDDPDVTDGILVFARAARCISGVAIDGGEGVGRVTKPGLDQPVGAAAINSVPRRMIEAEVLGVCQSLGYAGGISVTISIPGGEALAKKTFNPRMGIEGGLSVIGTSGIVEPMSSRALIDSILLEARMLRASGERDLLLVPGNYGETFSRERLGLRPRALIQCANFIGDAVDGAVELGFRRILIVGHIGKLVKLGIGITNTHSAFGDGRMETLLACALKAGAGIALLEEILASATTDAALQALEKGGLLRPAMAELGARIEDTLRRRVPESVEIGCVCFTNAPGLGGVLTKSGNAETLLKLWRD